MRADIGGHVERPEGAQAEAPRLAPREKLPRRPRVRGARLIVGDLRREELEKVIPRTHWPTSCAHSDSRES
jgi:hypothetical protein